MTRERARAQSPTYPQHSLHSALCGAEHRAVSLRPLYGVWNDVLALGGATPCVKRLCAVFERSSEIE